MQLYIALGSALMQVMAVAVTAEKLLTEALKIAESENDIDAQLQALWGLWGCAYYRGEYAAGKPFVERFSVVARHKGDLADMLVADRCTGITVHYEGNQIEARACLERVLHLYAAPDDQRHARWFHHDQRAVTRAFLARAQWLQGHVDQAAVNADTALQEAQAAHHDLSARYVLGWAVCPIAILTGNFAAAEASLKMFTELVARHHPPYWKALGAALEGVLLIKQGELRGGTARLRMILDTQFGESGLMRSPYFLNALAEGLTGLGQVADALVIVEEAFERSVRTGELWCAPDQLRVKGELLARGADRRAISTVEDCFVQAITMAQEQGALSWELKAAMSLAKVRLSQDRQDEARPVLASVYDRFTEGFESADLREARGLLALIDSQTSLQD
jgi:tetratricopeptide (TPR) repeat protein